MHMRQKLAIPVFGNRISSRLDCSESILLVTVDNGTILQRQEMLWTHGSILERIHVLLEEGVAILICGGLTDTCAEILRDSNIHVIPWIRGDVEDVLTRFIHGTLQSHGRQQT